MNAKDLNNQQFRNVQKAILLDPFSAKNWHHLGDRAAPLAFTMEESLAILDYCNTPNAEAHQQSSHELEVEDPSNARALNAETSRYRTDKNRDPTHLLTFAKSLLDNIEYDECIVICAQIISQTDASPEQRAYTHFFRGKCLMSLGKPKEGLSELITSFEVFPISYCAIAIAEHYNSIGCHEKEYSYLYLSLRTLPRLIDSDQQVIEVKISKLADKMVFAPDPPKLQIDFRKKYINENFTTYPPSEDIYGAIQDNPLVSILIVAYNSNNDLKDCFESIISQTYQDWEVIIVDNGTNEDCFELAKHYFRERCQYLKQPNIGFAKGNNVAASLARGDLFLLLNPDAALQQECIKELITSIRFDGSCAIVCPKIYFKTEFIKITIKGPENSFSLDLESSTSDLEYKKCLMVDGWQNNAGHISPSENGVLSFEYPITPKQREIKLRLLVHGSCGDDHHPPQKLFATIGRRAKPIQLSISTSSYWFCIKLKKYDYSSSRLLINNAGSSFRDDGTPYDRGYAEEDNGQFAAKEYISAFCGCCALIRRNIFAYRKIFVDEFFAYYEDTELSKWCQLNNLPILFAPQACVYHKHSEATVVSSPSWLLLTYRSRLIYEWITTGQTEDLSEILESDKTYRHYLSNVNEALSMRLMAFDSLLSNRSRGDLITRYGMVSISAYNSYMNSCGGGEKHLISFMQVLANAHSAAEITFISEREFDINELIYYFQIPYFDCSRLLVGKMSPKLTAFFDLFINSTFLSEHRSLCLRSYYIVSFPAKVIPAGLLNKYIFLHNSDFTQKWAQRYWGDHANTVVYPVLGSQIGENLDFITSEHTSICDKEKLIISIGRYNYGGHCKNQHIIANAFKKLLEINPDLQCWRLRLMGSLDQSSEQARKHFQDINLISLDFPNIEVLADVSPELIADSYRRAAIYVHATGCGVDVSAEPEKTEHFGISVFEAIQNYCRCIVHASGGPELMTKDLLECATYTDENELIDVLERVMLSYAPFTNASKLCQDFNARTKKIFDLSLAVINDIASKL